MSANKAKNKSFLHSFFNSEDHKKSSNDGWTTVQGVRSVATSRVRSSSRTRLKKAGQAKL